MNLSLGKIVVSANDSIARKLYLHTVIVAIFLLIVISINIWAGNTLTMITAITRFERTHTVSRVEAMVAFFEYHDHKKPEELERFQAKMAITQSYNKVFSRLLDMRINTTDAEFARILERTFSETDHKTAVIIVNRMKVLYWHPILKELVADAVGANATGEKLKSQVAQFFAATNAVEREALLAEIYKTRKTFISYETSFSKSCSDLSNQISSYVNYITMLLLIISVGFTGLLTYMITRSIIQQAAKYTSDLEKEIQARKLTEDALLLLKNSLQEQNEELQVNEEELRSQNDELQSTEEMLRVQINEYETSQKLLKEREESLHRQNNLFSSLLQILPVGVFMVEAPSGKPLVANEAAYNLLGRGILPDASKENLSNVYKAFKAGTRDPYPPEEMPIILGMNGVTSYIDDMEVERPDGTKTLLEIYGAPVTDDNGSIWASLVSFIDITERKQAELALKQSERDLRQMAESMPQIVWITRPDGWNIYFNQQWMDYTGLTLEESTGHGWNKPFHPDDQQRAWDAWENATRYLGKYSLECRLRRADGEYRWWLVRGVPVLDEHGTILKWFGTCTDIDEFKKAEEAKLTLEQQLQQAQKMESVGRLAGGVAHDFNNMLAVILGHAELGLMKIAPDDPLAANLKEISKTAERSADLTRQLLTFARKQTVAPKVLDLNETVSGMLKMLQRLIGENLNLTWQPAAALWQTKIDPSQVDQIMANLCVNARDAIEDTGKITIETENCTIDADYCTNNKEAVPGDYVRLSVSDDGAGMNRETLTHIFEPFYTTKEMGKGTGLGLATVYGAVKQNNGFINIYSEPGQGTTFSIYLPREATSNSCQSAVEGPVAAAPRGQETILLVEDEPAILNIASLMLEQQGYTVLKADTPGRAIELAREHHGEIHLLMTDVIMPDMNGRDLSKNVLSIYPGLKRLFMSGYTADVIAHHGVLDEGVNFIQKPFSLQSMAAIVRDVLDGK